MSPVYKLTCPVLFCITEPALLIVAGRLIGKKEIYFDGRDIIFDNEFY